MSRVAITGAFSYSGRYLAKLLLAQGHEVVNLSSRPRPIAVAPLEAKDLDRIHSRPLNFDEDLTSALRGCSTLWCTYWIRFQHGDSFAAAAQRCARLFAAAKASGVQRVVFTSHTHATVDSPFPYIAGKAQAVEALRALGLPYAVARPCGIFGDTAAESILMNNAAWVIRRSPLFLLAGDGQQRFQPIHVRDMAQLLLELGQQQASLEVDACGPDAPTATELFTALARATGSRTLVKAPGLSTKLVTQMTKPINWLTGDILLDNDDLDLLASGLTVAEQPEDPRIAKRRSLMRWIEERGRDLGQEYISSIGRYYYAR